MIVAPERPLRGIQGRFMLSINDRPEVRSIFEGFDIEDVTTTYSAGAGAPIKAAELLTTNPLRREP